jgi:hypothetical protein
VSSIEVQREGHYQTNLDEIRHSFSALLPLGYPWLTIHGSAPWGTAADGALPQCGDVAAVNSFHGTGALAQFPQGLVDALEQPL